MGRELHVRHLTGGKKGEERTYREFPLRIGRGDDCQLRFDPDADTKVSALHAEVRLEAEAFRIFDLDSKNGLFLDGERVRDSPLPRRATLQVGKAGPRIEIFARDGARGFSFNDARKTDSGPRDGRTLVSTDDAHAAYASSGEVAKSPKARSDADERGLEALVPLAIVFVALLGLGAFAFFALG